MVPSQIKLKIRDRNINRPCTGHTRLTHVSGCKSRTSRVRDLGSSTRSVYCVFIKYLILKEYVIDLKQQRKKHKFQSTDLNNFLILICNEVIFIWVPTRYNILLKLT